MITKLDMKKIDNEIGNNVKVTVMGNTVGVVIAIVIALVMWFSGMFVMNNSIKNDRKFYSTTLSELRESFSSTLEDVNSAKENMWNKVHGVIEQINNVTAGMSYLDVKRKQDEKRIELLESEVKLLKCKLGEK